MDWIDRAKSSAATYSSSMVWAAGCVLAAGISRDYFSLAFGFIAFTLIAVLAVMFGMLREMRTVHSLVEAQRVELTARIEDLTAALKDAGVPVPQQRKEMKRRATDPYDSVGYRNRRR